MKSSENNNDCGFSLVEVMIYITLLGLMAGLVMTGTVSMLALLQKQYRKLAIQESVWAAHDVLSRDVYAAPYGMKQWKCITSNACVWADHGHDLGVMVEKNTLYRVVGLFDFDKQTWIKKRRTVLCNNVEHFSLVPHKAGTKIIGLTIMITARQNESYYSMERMLTLRKRVVA